MKQKLLWSDKLLWHGLTGTQQGEETLTLLIHFQHWWPWREKQKPKLQTYQGSYIMWHVNWLSHRGCSDMISTFSFSVIRSQADRSSTGVNTSKTHRGHIRDPITQTTLVGLVASDNILLAVCTDMWPEPHWKTTYSTDVLQEEAKTITMDSTLSDWTSNHNITRLLYKSHDFGVAVWGETLLQYILNYLCLL